MSDAAEPRPKRERPRDELGRPLSQGSENRLDLEDFDALTVEENHRLAVRHFNAGRFFPAHEAWETAWKKSKGTPDEEFFKGLSQLGAGYTHHARGNPHGTHVLIRRATGRISAYGPEHRGVRISVLVEEAERHAVLAEKAERDKGAVPRLDPPRI